jgi:hypothetical protein
VDLSSVFMPLQFGGQYPETGYKVLGGADLNTLFCKKYSSTEPKTSLLLSDGQDLSDVFEKRHNVGYTGFFSLTQGIRVVYPFSPSITYIGGDNGTFRYWDSSNNVVYSNIGTFGGNVREIYARNTTNVYVGGFFTNANSYGNTAYLAKYTGSGTIFTQVSSTALNAGVSAMSALDPSNVYIGGDFTNGGTLGIRLSRFNTHSNIFTALTSVQSDVSLNSSVLAISALDISNVYIGGTFTNAGNIGSYITKWDGEKFNKLGSGSFDSGVSSIHALDPSHVYISGAFTKYGTDASMNKIAMWDGENMTALGSGLTGDVRTIYALDENHVYIGGVFTHIKMWNGRDCITLAGGEAFGLSGALSLNMVQGNKSTLYFGGGGGGVQKWTT